MHVPQRGTGRDDLRAVRRSSAARTAGDDAPPAAAPQPVAPTATSADIGTEADAHAHAHAHDKRSRGRQPGARAAAG